MTDLDLLSEIAEALDASGAPAKVDGERLVVDGAAVELEVVGRAHPHPAELADLVASWPDEPGVVVADRISEAGREVLRRSGWGFLDRRGWLRIWRQGLRIDTAIEGTGATTSDATDPWTTVGLEIAVRGLTRPDEPIRARRVAAEIGRSVSYVHDLIGRFTHLGLIGSRTHRPLLPDLFWEAAAHWPDDGWVAVPAGPGAIVTVTGHDDLVRVDERAATLGGARIPAAGDLPPRFYVTSAGLLRKLRAAIDRTAAADGAGDTATAAAPGARTLVRVAPVGWLPDLDPLPEGSDGRWRVAHPIVCALRLAADPSRGREVVEQWHVVPGLDPA